MTSFSNNLCVLLLFVLDFTEQSTPTELKLISNQVLELTNTRHSSDSTTLRIHFSGIEILNNTKSDVQNGIWSFQVSNFPNEAIRFTRSRVRSTDFATEYTFAWNIILREHYAYKKVCFQNQVDNLYWYSTFLQPDTTYWPMNAANQDPNDNQRNPNHEPNPGPISFFTDSGTPRLFGTTIEYLFLNSHGFAVMLDDLHFWTFEQKSNNPLWCISTAEKTDDMDHVEQYKSLKFRILVAHDIKTAWQSAIGHFGYIQRPRTVPHDTMFKYPIFSVSSIDLGKFVQQNTFESHIFIDKTSFDLAGEGVIIDILRRHDYPITFSIPFNGQFIDSFEYYLDNIDYTFESLIWKILRSNFNGKFDWLQFSGGSYYDFEINKTTNRLLSDEICGKYQNFITTRYAQACVQFNPRMVAIESTFKAQALGAFVRVKIDYEKRNPIPKLIQNVLALSLAGYQFIMPELINFSPIKTQESLDMYIQWLQVVTFLPAMQVPGSPWAYIKIVAEKSYEDAVQHVLECLKIRAEIVLPRLMNLTKRWIQNGEPIIRPMWYADPTDTQLYTIDNQFMIGDDLLVVAPKREQAPMAYLPKGKWKRGKSSGKQKNSDKIYHGNRTLALDATSGLLYFIRV